jgi:uncharacterized protein YjbI with pentapeptide repeats
LKRFTKKQIILAVSVVLVVVAGGISWFAFASGNDMGEGAIAAKSVDEAKVPVSVVLSSDARRLNVTIDWNDELDALRGDDRFNARVMAGIKEIELKQWEDTRPDVDQFTLEFTEAEATLLLAAVDNGDAVVAITQQSDTDLDSDSLYEANYATVVRIQAPNASALPAGFSIKTAMKLSSPQVPATLFTATSPFPVGSVDCTYLNLGPGVLAMGCDLNGAFLSKVDLSNANLSYANLSRVHLDGGNLPGASLIYANMSEAELNYGTNLSGANMAYAELSGASLNQSNLSSADLSFADLTAAFLSQVNVTGTVWYQAKCYSGALAAGSPPVCPITS